jgi:ABC-2 type transport system ATP-binding protein
MLEVKNLSKSFGEVHAVRGINFQIRRGEIVGFLGPNGAGKTTTMQMITCYMPATSGNVLVDGMDTVEHSLDVRKKIGYLAENNPLYGDMTVLEYLQFVGEIRGLTGARRSSRIQEMFAVCNLSKMAHRLVGKLSKGYRQRVGLAQAMMHNPDLLILDEPMSGLDPNQIIEIRQLIKKIGEEKTVVYSSHILAEVQATCNRVIVINEGRLVVSGAPDEVIANAFPNSRYTMSLKTTDRASVQSKLSGVDGVLGVAFQPSTTLQSEGWITAEVNVKNREEIGGALFSCAVANGWSVGELKRDTMSLEEAFTKVTRS